MVFFILMCLSTLIVALLVMLSSQLIRVEKQISDITDLTEVKVKKLYGKK